MNKHLNKNYESNSKKNLISVNQKRVDKINKNNNYNDSEMNSLNYDDAKKHDKRNYCQYYISLLRTNHILIFFFAKIKIIMQK